MPISVLVVTVVHDPRDARIAQREIPALLAAGDRVTFAAPFTDYGVNRPPGMATVDLPRAHGRRRAAAVRAARSVITRLGPSHDVVLLHDPELLLSAARSRHPLVVWDVHEDTGAALTLKQWLPEHLRSPVRHGVRFAEARAERSYRLLLAEERYRERFANEHPVVPNTTPVPRVVPPPQRREAVYLGRVSVERGGLDLIETGRLLRADGISVVIIGTADERMSEPLSAAQAAGWITWTGFVPNDVALTRIEGAGVGLSLLHDQPNYRVSMPTKVIEYMARGIPVVTTPLPLADQLVREAQAGAVVPFEDPVAAADAVRSLLDDDDLRLRMGAAGHDHALAHLNWDADGPAFARLLEEWVAQSRSR